MQNIVHGEIEMRRNRAEHIFKPSKPSSVKSEGERADALAEYRSGQDLIRGRTAIQRTNWLRVTARTACSGSGGKNSRSERPFRLISLIPPRTRPAAARRAP